LENYSMFSGSSSWSVQSDGVVYIWIVLLIGCPIRMNGGMTLLGNLWFFSLRGRSCVYISLSISNEIITNLPIVSFHHSLLLANQLTVRFKCTPPRRIAHFKGNYRKTLNSSPNIIRQTKDSHCGFRIRIPITIGT